MIQLHVPCVIPRGGRGGATGFIKYALQYGYDLLPCYHLGETQLYDILFPFDMPWALRCRLWLAQNLALATGLGVGFRLLPIAPKPNIRCLTVVGKRISLPQIDTPSRDDVNRYHQQYIREVSELYERHRRLHPAYAEKQLEIW